MAITDTDRSEPYPADDASQRGGAQDERAARHRAGALAALADGDHAVDALVHALLAIEARVEELSCFVAALR